MGREITDRITRLATHQTLKSPQSAKTLRSLVHQFRRMYEPHEAREDTVLFPAFRELVSKEEYGALGEAFEKKEHELFGDDGFHKIVERVAGIREAAGDRRPRLVYSQGVMLRGGPARPWPSRMSCS